MIVKATLALLPLLAFAGGMPLRAQVSSIQNDRPGTSNAVQQSRDALARPDEVVCRVVPPPLGSRLGAKRTCATRAQWADMDVGRGFARRNIEQVQQALPCNGEHGCLGR
jgi:hypothetical protein